ncbi:MAG: hypothetical protein R3281_17850 [Balneolaceae bacterium]|nr:hypothetical protein [Balneolaceae bacterium]
MNRHSDGKFKKWLVALLLLVSCVISALLLVFGDEGDTQRLGNFAQADSLISDTFRQFGITRSQVRVTDTRVDSVLTRKTYTVDVPPGFSKTMLHAELNRVFHPLSVRTPARVSLPEKRMRIQLVYDNTVIRTLALRTDECMVLDRDIASILVAFDEEPTRSLLQSVIRFGEPIPVALRVSGAEQAREQKGLLQQYPYLCYWINTNREGAEEGSALPPATVLDDFPPKADILSFERIADLSGARASSIRTVASEHDMAFIDASDALILDSDLGESIFKQELEKFAARARRQEHPVAVVMADEEALEWLRQKLVTFKKQGLYLIHPPKIHF